MRLETIRMVIYSLALLFNDLMNIWDNRHSKDDEKEPDE